MRIKVSTRQCVTSYHTKDNSLLGPTLWADRDKYNQEITDPEDVNRLRYDLAYLVLQNIEKASYRKIVQYIQNTSSKGGFCDQKKKIYYRVSKANTCVGCCFAYDNEQGEPRCYIVSKCKLIKGHYKAEYIGKKNKKFLKLP